MYICFTQTGKYGEYNLGIIAQNKNFSFNKKPNYLKKVYKKK